MATKLLNTREQAGLEREVTPQHLFNRRKFLLQGFSAAALGGMGQISYAGSAPDLLKTERKSNSMLGKPSCVAGANLSENLTSLSDATSYNNFYEFSTDKAEPASAAKSFQTDNWSVQIEGLVKKPIKITLEDLLKLRPMEERIYRMRCVEGWSMVIPWVGYSLSDLIKVVEPLGSAKYVQFVSLADPKQMPGIRSGVLDWPYTEGLRMDEAMHPLTLLTFGMYGQVLPNQSGAPIRLVVPWKYGFKSAKSIARIRFTETMPKTAWNSAASSEYGFYSNVNPNVDHPRWSQATERRIGEGGGIFSKKRKTLMFNGYEEQVGQLYTGMDLQKFF